MIEIVFRGNRSQVKSYEIIYFLFWVKIFYTNKRIAEFWAFDVWKFLYQKALFVGKIKID